MNQLNRHFKITFFPILVILLSISAFGQDMCSEIFSDAKRFLDQSYKVLVVDQPDVGKKALAVHALLREAFTPMMEKFRGVVETSKPEDIKQILKERNSLSRLTLTPYTKNNSLYSSITFPLVQLPTETGSPERAKFFKETHGAFDFSAANGVNHHKFFRRTQEEYGILEQPAAGYGRVSNALWAENPPTESAKYGLIHKSLGTLVTPVGFYGLDFSKALLRTTQVLIEMATKNLESESSDLFTRNPLLLKGETARARDSGYKGGETGTAPLVSFAEGIVSFHQFLSMMMAEKVPGVESGHDALKEIIFNSDSRLGLTAEFTARLPMGLIGPLTLTGTHIEHPLIRTADNKLALSPNLKEILKKAKDASGERRKKGVCPMASLFRMKPSDPPETAQAGLQILAETYWRVFQTVEAEMASDAHL